MTSLRPVARHAALRQPPGVPRPLKCARVLQLPTGLVHDPSHSRHQHPRRKHPERPERIDAIMTHLQASKLLDACTAVPSTNADEEGMRRAQGRKGSEAVTSLHDEAGGLTSGGVVCPMCADLVQVHNKYYIKRLSRLSVSRKGHNSLSTFSQSDGPMSGVGVGGVRSAVCSQWAVWS